MTLNATGVSWKGLGQRLFEYGVIVKNGNLFLLISEAPNVNTLSCKHCEITYNRQLKLGAFVWIGIN